MFDIVFIVLITGLAATVFWHYRQSPGIEELCSKFIDHTNQDIEWTTLGVLVEGGKNYGIFWDGFGRVGFSTLGIHYKSFFHPQIHIPWSEVTISAKPSWMGIPYGRRYRISSPQLDKAAIFVSKKSINENSFAQCVMRKTLNPHDAANILN